MIKIFFAEKESEVTCTRVDDAMECVPNAECKTVGSDLKCTCNTRFYDDNFSNTGGQCVSGRVNFCLLI